MSIRKIREIYLYRYNNFFVSHAREIENEYGYPTGTARVKLAETRREKPGKKKDEKKGKPRVRAFQQKLCTNRLECHIFIPLRRAFSTLANSAQLARSHRELFPSDKRHGGGAYRTRRRYTKAPSPPAFYGLNARSECRFP